MIMKDKKPFFAITPHPQAPLFNKESNPQLLIQQLIGEMTGSGLHESEKLRKYLRQASLVNLWYFERYILGFNGPYTKLNDGLHLEMANWRQSPACMGKGARGAGFVPRSYYKSTIWTHGAIPWEIVRFPNIRIRLESGIFEKAEEFLGIIKDMFEQNTILTWLFPETAIPSNYGLTGDWSGRAITIPSRDRFYPDPTVKIGSMTGASEGGHVNLYACDDPVGLDDLDSQRSSSTDMYRKKNRFINNKTTLLDEAEQDRVVLVGTRYALDDLYDVAINDAYEFVGYQLPEFKTNPEGEWSIYNRLGEEDGEFILPSKLNKKILDKAMREDRWFAMTQLINYPQKAGLAELNELPAKTARLEYDDEKQDYAIIYETNNYENTEEESVFLSECDVVMSLDPAGTDKGISAKTSRSSLGIWARDYKDRLTRIYSRVGYYKIDTLFDYIFEGHRQFPGYIRATVIESNAMQKILLPIIRREEIARNMYINPQGKPESQNKVVRIRNTLGIILRKGNLYLVNGCDREFREELLIFPMNEYKMDVLDESEKGISSTYTPESGESRMLSRFIEEDLIIQASDNVFGY